MSTDDGRLPVTGLLMLYHVYRATTRRERVRLECNGRPRRSRSWIRVSPCAHCTGEVRPLPACAAFLHCQRPRSAAHRAWYIGVPNAFSDKQTIDMFVPQASTKLRQFLSWIMGQSPEFVDPKFVAQGKGREGTHSRDNPPPLCPWRLLPGFPPHGCISGCCGTHHRHPCSDACPIAGHRQRRVQRCAKRFPEARVLQLDNSIKGGVSVTKLSTPPRQSGPCPF